jgi:hypothetical protein
MRGEGKTLEAYSNETDCTKALTAAWHLYVQPGLANQPALANQLARPQKFLRFVEAHVGVPVPLRWQLAVIWQSLQRTPDALAAEMESYLPRCPFLKKGTPSPGLYTVTPETYRALPPLVSVGPGLNVARKGSTLVVKQASETITIEAADVDLDAQEPDHLSGLLTHDQAFFARYDSFSNPYRLYCFNAPSGQLRWEAQCWGTGWCGTVGGNCFHSVWFAAARERIAVFGDGRGLYLEVFDKSSGKSLGRFASNCWTDFDWSDELDT